MTPRSLWHRVRAGLVRREYRSLCERYSRTANSSAAHSRSVGIADRTVRGAATGRVFFLGTDYEQDYSGLIQALERAADVRVFTRRDGVYGQNDPRPPAQRRPDISRRLYELFETNGAQGWVPDVLIGQTWASVIDPTVFSRIRERWGTLIVNISMDDRHQFLGPRIFGGQRGGVLPLVPHLDLALTTAPECVHWYESEGCPAMFFPEASDPAIFRPMPDLPKLHDVAFVGARYGIRDTLVTGLRCAGIDVRAHGAGWEGGRLSIDETARLFAQSRIVLGVGTIGYSRDFYALKLRDFDAPMSGSCYLTHDNPDLRSLFEVGQEIEIFTDVDDCVSKVRRLLGNDEQRERIAAAGRRRAERDHTWDRRIGDLFDHLRRGA